MTLQIFNIYIFYLFLDICLYFNTDITIFLCELFCRFLKKYILLVYYYKIIFTYLLKILNNRYRYYNFFSVLLYKLIK